MNVNNIFLQANIDFPYLGPFFSACILSFWMMRPLLVYNLNRSVDRAPVYARKLARIEKLRKLEKYW